ncbi:MAG TPA: tetratricopeptide repeat protein, partial [bacterium]|nr:tetratricopeptide repeat protein [bacterium]
MNKYYFSILVLIIFCASCAKTKPSSKTTTITKLENDSISIWSAKSQKLTTTKEEKLKLQLKAYDIAENSSNDSLKASYFSTLSFNQNFITDSSLFRKINKRAITINEKIQDSSALGMAYWDMGYFLQGKVVKDSAFYYYSEALNIFENLKDHNLTGGLYLQMAGIQMKIKDYSGSEANTIKAIENFKIENNNKKLFNSYNLLGIVLGDLEEYDKSLTYYNEALYYLRKTEDKLFGEEQLINNIGVIYRNTKKYDKAIENFESVINANKIFIKNPNLYSKALSNLATTKLYNEDTLGIHNLLIEAIDIKHQEKELGSLASSYYGLAEYNLYAKDTLNALANAKKAIKFSIESN